MASSKFMIAVHRCVGILGLLMIGGITARLFYLHEYLWAWLYTAGIIFVLYNFIKDFSRYAPRYSSYYSLVIGLLFPCWHEYSNYKRDIRLKKYGLIYNKTRHSLGIPTIPVTWHAERPENRSIEWRGKNGVLGHEEKYIVLDSRYNIEYERDEYNFKGVHDISRSISILFDYARGKSRDSIHYWYYMKDTMLNLTRHQADSIFDANNIRKDY